MSLTDVIIRPMTADDYDGAYDVWLNIPGMGLNSTDDSREGIEKYLKRNPSTCFVAVCGEKIVGTVLSGHDGRRGYIQHLAVLPEYRNRKIATELVENAMTALEKEGISKAALLTFAKNEAGNAFWEKMGFTVRHDLYYRNKEIRSLEYHPNIYRNE